MSQLKRWVRGRAQTHLHALDSRTPSYTKGGTQGCPLKTRHNLRVHPSGIASSHSCSVASKTINPHSSARGGERREGRARHPRGFYFGFNIYLNIYVHPPMCANMHRNETGRKCIQILKVVFMGGNILHSLFFFYFAVSMDCFYNWGRVEM